MPVLAWCPCALCRPSSSHRRCCSGCASQDMSKWVLQGEKEGVRRYSGVGKFASARGDGVIDFPPKYGAATLCRLFCWRVAQRVLVDTRPGTSWSACR